MDVTTVRLVAGILAALLLGIILFVRNWKQSIR
jgi:hypothetical protein